MVVETCANPLDMAFERKIAFSSHTISGSSFSCAYPVDLVNSTYQKVRELLVTRTSFFNDIRTLLKYFWFENWQDFFLFILRENVPLKQVNSS